MAWAHQQMNSGQTGEVLFGGPPRQRLMRAPPLSKGRDAETGSGHRLHYRAQSQNRPSRCGIHFSQLLIYYGQTSTLGRLSSASPFKIENNISLGGLFS